MRILTERLAKSTCSSLCVALALIYGASTSHADSISDVLTVSDSFGLPMTKQLLESKEPGNVSIVIPARVLDITNPGRTQLSDILSISAITVTLFSDGNTSGGPEPPEDPAMINPIVITARSDQNTTGGISDTLLVDALMQTIPESAEPAEAKINVLEKSIPFGNGGDSIRISAFTVDLVSLKDAAGADVGSMTDTITITATSDPGKIPEPSTLSLLALGLASAGALSWLRGCATH